MHNLDITQMGLVGLSEGRKGEIANPLQKRCEGCHTHVYLSRAWYRNGLRIAASQKQRAIIVCKACVRAWIQDIAINGGAVAGSPDVLRDEYLPELRQARQDHNQRN